MNSKSKMKDHEYKSSSNGVSSNKISTGIYELTLELKENLKLDNAKIIPKITMAYTYSVKANVKNYSYGN